MTKQLRSGGSSVKILPDCGMNCMEIILRGKSIMRPLSGEEELRANPNVYGTPALLPANRTAGGRFSFRGREYSLGINEPERGNFLHGYLSSAVFSVDFETEDTIKAHYINSGEIFPFPFRLDVCCRLSESSCILSYTFENIGDEAMPICFAVHAAFRACGKFDVPIGMAEVLDSSYIPTGELRSLSIEEQAFFIGAEPQRQRISGFYTRAPGCAHIDDIELMVSDNFNRWILWNQDGEKGFICIEPQCGAVNCLNSGRGLLTAEPGEKKVFTLSLRRLP